MRRTHYFTDGEALVQAAEDHYRLPKGSIRGESKERAHAWPRQLVMYAGKARLGWSFPAAARAVGRVNHTTAFHAYHRFQERALKDNTFARDLEAIMGKFMEALQDRRRRLEA